VLERVLVFRTSGREKGIGFASLTEAAEITERALNFGKVFG